jgi:transposase
MLGGTAVKQLWELHGQQRSIREIARTLGLSRNTVRKYLRTPGLPAMKPRPPQPSKLDAFREHIHRRLADGLENCVVLLRELRAQGYTGGYSVLKDYVRPRRLRRAVKATMRFETKPGEQAQVDFGHFAFLTPSGQRQWLWGFVMVLAWSRLLYVEFVRRADVATFIRCHLHAFERFGGVPRHCLYDNTKVVVLGRDAAGTPRWNTTFLDFALRLGFDARLCQPYRAQTKGRVESGIKYVRYNFWPTAVFEDLAGLNRDAQAWSDTVANVRCHGTTNARPIDRFTQEQAQLLPAPGPGQVAPFLREERLVGRDGFVAWERAWYGVPWRWAGQRVHVAATDTTVEIWDHGDRIAVHPRATRIAQRFTLPGQWAGLARPDGRPGREPLGRQRDALEVEVRALSTYDVLVGAMR